MGALLLEGPMVEHFVFNTYLPVAFTAYILLVVVLAETGWFARTSAKRLVPWVRA